MLQEQLGLSPYEKELLQRLRGLEKDAAQRVMQVEKEHQRAEDAYAGTRLMIEQQALELEAGAAAARMKEYRAWHKEPGEFDSCPQLPRPGELLQYFASEEGILAQRNDPLLSSGREVVSRSLPPQRPQATLSEAYANKGLFGLTGGAEDFFTPTEASAHLRSVTAGSPSKPSSPKNWEERTGTQVPASGDGTGPEEEGLCLRTYPAGQTGPGGVKLPSISTRSQRPTAILNDAYLAREYQAMKLVKTASAELIRARGLDDVEFKLGSQLIEFGEVPVGSVLQQRLALHNVSLQRARFSVDQVPLPLKLSYSRTPVPAGLKTHILIELNARDVGLFEGRVVVRSAVNVLECKVRAHVVQAGDDC